MTKSILEGEAILRRTAPVGHFDGPSFYLTQAV